MIVDSQIEVSIVVPIFNESGNIERLYDEILQVMQNEVSWEIFFVDDGSTDDSWQKIKFFSERDIRVRGLRFSRNFGHQHAIMSGLKSALGRSVITMDGDLQHPPSVLPRLLDEWRKGFKIVNTVRIDNKDTSFMKKVSSRMFYKLFSFLSGVDISAGMADFRLLDRQVVTELLKLNENTMFLRGLVQWVGFSNTKVLYQSQNRYSGESKYTFYKMLKFAWKGITSFSIVPLRVGIIVGIITSIFAFYQLGEAIYMKIFTDETVPGWASTIGLISLLFGVLFILIGLLGEYIGRILIEVRGRPRYIISETLGGKLQETDSPNINLQEDEGSFFHQANVQKED